MIHNGDNIRVSIPLAEEKFVLEPLQPFLIGF